MNRAMAFCCVVVAISAGSATFAQDVEFDHEVGRELHIIGERTAQAVTLLQQLLDQRATEIELRRLQVAVLALQLRSSAIADIEARIQTLRDRASESQEYQTQFESELRRIDDLLAAETTSDQEKPDLESSRQMIVQQIDVAQQRTWSLERQTLDLENELVAKRQDVGALEEIVMENLSDF